MGNRKRVRKKPWHAIVTGLMRLPTAYGQVGTRRPFVMYSIGGFRAEFVRCKPCDALVGRLRYVGGGFSRKQGAHRAFWSDKFLDVSF